MLFLNVRFCIIQAFLEFDAHMLKEESMRDELAGTTAITVLVRGKQLFCV